MVQINIGSTALVAVLLLLPGASYGHENTCINSPLPPTKAALLKTYKAVFSGKVVRILAAHVHDVITFEVVRSWKGVDTREAELWKAIAGYKGVNFEVGETYLVFASGEDGVSQKLRIDSCSRSKKVAEAGPEINLLDE